jgi:hypothetical protein
MRLKSVALIGGVLLGATLVSVGPPAAVAAPAPSVPQVRITMTDGVTAPRLHSRVTYTVVLANRDRVSMPMQVRMAVPAGLTDVTATGGSRTGRSLSWNTPLLPGAEVSVAFTGVVAGPSHRLAVTACAYVGSGPRPIACASDLDGVVVPAASHGWLEAALGGAGLLLVLLAIGAIALMRRRRSIARGSGDAAVDVPTGGAAPAGRAEDRSLV